jgi:hypothetical protein
VPPIQAWLAPLTRTNRTSVPPSHGDHVSVSMSGFVGSMAVGGAVHVQERHGLRRPALVDAEAPGLQAHGGEHVGRLAGEAVRQDRPAGTVAWWRPWTASSPSLMSSL